MSMLSEILATKRTDVSHRKQRQTLADLEKRFDSQLPLRDFRAAIEAAPGIGLIAEIKKASPSKGIIRADFDPLAIAQTYAEYGATCLSVLTEETYFQGHLNYLTQIREIVTLPLMRKDFIVDAWQIAESRAYGADAILLIVAALCPTDLRAFLKTAEEYGLAALVEVHDHDELLEALDAGATLIGINNRDLHTFRTTLSTTLELMKTLPANPDLRIVSESGIFTCSDVKALQAAGVHAILIGEALMREADIGAKLRELLSPVREPALTT